MDYQEKIEQIVKWIKSVYKDRPGVIAVSGGVDSAVALTLLVKALGIEKVTALSLPYHDQDMTDAKMIVDFNKLTNAMEEINIGDSVDKIAETLGVGESTLRKGNIMARVRMIMVYDYAKANGAFVCGTENKSEQMLGYFTRFGDSAADIEPIAHLYKTEVWEMAKELGLPEVFYTKAPTAGLWEGQSDEVEMGFTYREADKVLKGETSDLSEDVIKKITKRMADNKFKLETPYML